MNILVTGGGFIGSHFARLVKNVRPDYKVVILDALTYSGNISTIQELIEGGVKFYPARIEDRDAVRAIVDLEGIDHIVNFAAESHNDRSILGDSSFFTSNAIGVESLLDVTRDAGLKRMLHVSTDEVYGTIDSGRFTEESPILPNTPYSASKAGGELACRAHRKAFGTPVVVTRGGNTYGPYQYPEKLISFFSVRLILGKKVPVYGDGLQVREWMHAHDHANGILTALERGDDGEIYNVGDDNEHPNREVVNILLRETGHSDLMVRSIPDPRRGAHDKRYSMTSEKLRALGWQPEVPFSDGLVDTVSWYARHRDWWQPIVSRPEYMSFVARFYGPSLGADI